MHAYINTHLRLFLFMYNLSFIYTVSQKNVPHLTCYNLYIHSSIATIFGTNVAVKVGNQNVLYFPTSPN